jgi:hypothetical protein
VVGPGFPAGAIVTVAETIPAGHLVSSIHVAPASQLVGVPNLLAGSVDVTIGSGVTEVTFTDTRTGFVEICKRGDVRGDFTFVVNPGGLGPFTVPTGACSPAIEVAAGSVMIHERRRPGTSMVGCATTPASRQGGCNLGARISTVTVVPGDISTQTIAYITNRRSIVGDDSSTTHIHTTDSTATITMGCAPNPSVLGRPVTCTAKVATLPPRMRTPTGLVSFMEGNETLATVQLNSRGTAAFTTSMLTFGPHAIVVSYGGDAQFGPSASRQHTITVEQR